MMYIDDAVRATLELMEAKSEKLSVHTSYNLAAISFSPKEICQAIAKVVPGFSCAYEPDFHQAIADSWPKAIDDSVARTDWGWHHDYDLPKIVQLIIGKLQERFSKT